MAAWVGRSDAWQQGIFTQHWIGRIAQFYFKVTLLSEFQGMCESPSKILSQSCAIANDTTAFTKHSVRSRCVAVTNHFHSVTTDTKLLGIYIYASIRNPYRTLEGIQDAQHRTIPVLGVTLRLLLSDFRSHIIFASAGALRRFTSNHLSNQSCIQSH